MNIYMLKVIQGIKLPAATLAFLWGQTQAQRCFELNAVIGMVTCTQFGANIIMPNR